MQNVCGKKKIESLLKSKAIYLIAYLLFCKH